MINFILNNNVIYTHEKTGMTLLYFIREVQGLKGTKSGCKEGDCGACTVLSGSLQNDGTIKYKSITSCLTPLANIHNKHILTIEGLNIKEELNTTQKAIINNHGTQCGFCTPGFVMSLTNYALDNDKNKKAIEYLSGNICRCTGYKSIEKSANAIEEILKNNKGKADLNWLIKKKFVPVYFKDIPEKLKKLNKEFADNNKNLVGGGTDMYVKHADKLADEDIQTINNLVSNDIVFNDNTCKIGAGTKISDIMNNEKMKQYFPRIQKYLKLVSSTQIRNMGTVAGNIVNASPIGDMSIFFLALDSRLTIKNINSHTTRLVEIKKFFKDYKEFDLKESEIIQEISFDLPNNNSFFNFEKVSKRTHLDIASVNSAILIKIEKDIIKEIHISVGGVSAIPKYLRKTKDFLTNKPLSLSTLKEAQAILQKEISPMDDIRGTTQYKRLLARQLFFAHFIELFSNKFLLRDFIN